MILFNIVWNEIKKEFYHTWSYKWQWIGEFLSLFAFFFFLNMLTQKTGAGIAYCVWFYSVLIIGDISGKVSQEMRAGTFEQMYLSSIPIPILFSAKAIAAVSRALLIMTTLLMFFWFLGYVDFSFLEYKIIYVLLIITPGLFGISLFMGGVTILLKDTGFLMNILNNGFLFLSGIFIPISSLSNGFQKIALMIPTSQAISALNQDQLFMNDWVLMIIVNLFYLTTGMLGFFICERKAKMKGVLGHY